MGATTHLSPAAATGPGSSDTWGAGRGQEGGEEGLGEVESREGWGCWRGLGLGQILLGWWWNWNHPRENLGWNWNWERG